MAVDLGDLVEFLRGEINVPGVDSFTSASDEDWLVRLQNAFWHARLRGAFSGYTESDGLIVEDTATPTTDLPREQQQLIILMAALNVVRSALRNANTLFRSKAGPVEFETQQSAQTLKELLTQLNAEFKDALEAAVAGTDGATVAYFDAVISRSVAIEEGGGWYVR